MSSNGIVINKSIGAETIESQVTVVRNDIIGNFMVAETAIIGKQARVPFNTAGAGIPTPLSGGGTLFGDAMTGGVAIFDVAAGTDAYTTDTADNIIQPAVLSPGKSTQMIIFNEGAGNVSLTGGVGVTVIRGPIVLTGVESKRLLITVPTPTTVEIVEIEN